MASFTFEIPVWAVIIAAVTSFIIGGIWYGVLFAKSWASLNGHDEEALKKMAESQGRNLAVFFVCDIVMALVLSLLAVNLGVVSAGQGAFLGAMLWLGISATIRLSKNTANGKPIGAYLIDASHEFASLVTIGLIVGAWQ